MRPSCPTLAGLSFKGISLVDLILVGEWGGHLSNDFLRWSNLTKKSWTAETPFCGAHWDAKRKGKASRRTGAKETWAVCVCVCVFFFFSGLRNDLGCFFCFFGLLSFFFRSAKRPGLLFFVFVQVCSYSRTPKPAG